MTGRELFAASDQPRFFYVVGGMGSAPAIGFGIARALPRQRVVVLDGDGAALMRLGTLATIGMYQPSNLLHIILDNEAHDSTGGQPTASSIARFAQIAAALNYRRAITVNQARDLTESIRQLSELPGPVLLHVKIRPGSTRGIGRPALKPHETRERFMEWLKRQSLRPTEITS